MKVKAILELVLSKHTFYKFILPKYYMKKRAINTKNIKIFLICLLISYSVGYIGSIFTSQGVSSSWYESIKPPITPPSYVFLIVWNILFFLIALSLYFAWVNSNPKQKVEVGIIFAVNFVLNISWSIIYFSLQNPLFALIDIFAIIISIIAVMITVKRIDIKSYYLLYPYLIWVCFASLLNYLSIK